ncbi:MAG: glycerophosphodiester phosphodiesterase family protein [Pseudomonadales bacterium]|jgi:glycerophosphoryl diester phosphodiesterase|nr:glycerophosphodiester phosphodiesterase family protein [Pseudomonadales bacterium]
MKRMRTHLGISLLASCLVLPACAARQRAESSAFMPVPRLLDCARVEGATLLSAHRGGPRSGRPENSLAAMTASIEDGARFLEIDVARTADGALILMHDRTLDRTTTGSGPVLEQTLAALRRLRLVDADGAIHDAPPPTLAEAFELARGRAVLQLDVKGVEPERLVEAIRSADAAEQALVITYSVEDALELHALAPELMLSVGVDSLDDLDALSDAGLRLDRLVAWLGLGAGDPALDAALAERGVETSYGDFRGERRSDWDHAAHARAGAEILAVDDVPRAARSLAAIATQARLRQACSVP